MTNDEALRHLVAQWRDTADIWARQLEEWPSGPVRRSQVKATAPPAGSRQDIQNWINWLRYQADAVEAIVGRSPESGL